MMVIINFSEIFGVFQRMKTKCHHVASKEEQGHAFSLKSIHNMNFTKVDLLDVEVCVKTFGKE